MHWTKVEPQYEQAMVMENNQEEDRVSKIERMIPWEFEDVAEEFSLAVTG